MTLDPTKTLIFVDTETTGLMKPSDGMMLEFGTIITDADLNELARSSWIFAFDRLWWEAQRGELDPVVIEMHGKSGLWDDVRTQFPGHTPNQVDSAIADWFYERGVRVQARHPLVGNTVSFDRAWMEEHLPITHALFGYRNIDFSTIKELCQRWTVHDAETKKEPEKRELHRAIPDLEDSINLARYYKEFLF